MRKSRRLLALGWMLLLLGLPIAALVRLSPTMDLRISAMTGVMLSMIAFAVYVADKNRAQRDARRVPEITLHMLELAGGWPGAFLAQRWVRHKNRKVGYQVVFWVIVASYQVVSADFLLGWPLVRGCVSAMSLR